MYKLDKNIRLIVSDFDGTLLPEATNDLSPLVPTMVREIWATGAAFCAASGRQFRNLYTLMTEVADDIYFLSGNGSMVNKGKDLLRTNALPRDLALELIQTALDDPRVQPVVEGTKCGYVFNLGPDAPEYLILEGGFTLIKSLDELAGEDILKISMYVPNGIEEISAEYAAKYERRCNVAVSGRCWQDFTNCNKGEALAELCEELGISRDEVLAFGDNYNDVEMMQFAGTAIAPNSAVPPVLAAAAGTTDNVVDCIRHFALTGELPLREDPALQKQR